MDYFIFDGIDSRDYGIYLLSRRIQHCVSPNSSVATQKINGRAGLLVTEHQYTTRSLTLECWLDNVDLSNMRYFTAKLNSLGKHTVALSYEQYKVYEVHMTKQMTVEAMNKKGRFTINFEMFKAFAESAFSTLDIINGLEYDSGYFYDSGVLYGESGCEYEFDNITTTTNLNIYDGSSLDGARPNIIINGSADALTINHYLDSARTILKTSCDYGTFSGLLEIDSRVFNTFLDGSVDNATFIGDYFELIGKTEGTDGINYFEIKGANLNITNLKFNFKYIYL